MFVVATMLPVNMGVLAFVGAFLVGTLVAGMSTKDIIAGFPGGLFLTLVGITYLFALAQNNGTIDWLVQLAVRAVRGRIAAIPWIMFAIAAVLTSVGRGQPRCGRDHRPDRAGLRRPVRDQPAAHGAPGDPRRPGRRLLADQHLWRHHQRRRRQGRTAAERARHHDGELRRQSRRLDPAVLRARRPQAAAAARGCWRRHRRWCRMSTSPVRRRGCRPMATPSPRR